MTPTTAPPAPPAEGLDRRAVLVGAATVVAAAGTGALFVRRAGGTGGTGAIGGNGGTGPTVLAAVADVPPGGGLVVEQANVVLTRGADDIVRAFSATCTHQGCQVASVAAGTINCPCHGSRFDAATGAVVTGPASRPLAPVAVALSGDRIVTA